MAETPEPFGPLAERVAKMQQRYEKSLDRQRGIINRQKEQLVEARALVNDPHWQAELAGYPDFLDKMEAILGA